MGRVTENYQRILETVSGASGGRSVAVLGVTKYQPAERIREAIAAGVSLLGNNYAQEGEQVRAAFPDFRGQWHFIGHIQSRKVKFLPDYDCVQTLARIEVARKLSDRLQAGGRALPVMVEVNLGGEASKAGVSPESLPEFLYRLAELPGLRLTGLMCLPPPLYPVEKRRPFFARLRELRDAHRHLGLKELSMGTSEDYVEAIREGATLVRLGTALFGDRTP